MPRLLLLHLKRPKISRFRCGYVSVLYGRYIGLSHPAASFASTNAKYSMVITGIGRVRIDDYTTTEPYYRAHVTPCAMWVIQNLNRFVPCRRKFLKVRRIYHPLRKHRVMGNLCHSPHSVQQTVPGRTQASLPRHVGRFARLNTESFSKGETRNLETTDLNERLQKTLDMITKQAEMIKVTKQIQSKVSNKLKSSQREYYLREQLKAIQEELGETSGDSNEETDVIETLRAKLRSKNLPKEGERGRGQRTKEGPKDESKEPSTL